MGQFTTGEISATFETEEQVKTITQKIEEDHEIQDSNISSIGTCLELIISSERESNAEYQMNKVFEICKEVGGLLSFNAEKNIPENYISWEEGDEE